MKLYRSASRDAERSTLTIPSGVLDPLIGRSYAQIAAESRSRHRSQDFGALQRPGPATIRLELVDSRVPGPDTALFAGVDTALAGPRGRRFAALIDSARARLDPWRPAAVLPYLVRAREVLPPGDAERAATLQRAIAIAAGLTLDAVTDDDVVAAGQRVVQWVQRGDRVKIGGPALHDQGLGHDLAHGVAGVERGGRKETSNVAQ